MNKSFDNNALFYAACGGIILGISTSLNYIIRGKDTGMTRIMFNFATFNKAQIPETTTMLGGMFVVSSLFYLIFGNGNYNGFQPFGSDRQITKGTNLIQFFIAGFFIGFGAKLGGGCTSGHGLCGLGRLSLRSFSAVCMFLLTGILVATLTSSFRQDQYISDKTDLLSINHHISAKIIFFIGILLPIISLFLIKVWKQSIQKKKILDQILVFIIGGLFATGLLVSGMARRTNVLSFLNIHKNWNPSLLFVLSLGVCVNFITIMIMKKRGVSLNGSQLFNPVEKDKIVDWKIIIGGICFGLGWGISGICPGPFYVLFTVFTIPIQIFWGSGFIIGALLGAKTAEITQNSKISNKNK